MSQNKLMRHCTCMLWERVLVMLTCMFCYTMSLRVSRAIDWEACEFGDALQPYDETCHNGAKGLSPCNPGQLKVAECIGQGGDTSRVCDPCPQKFFQSNYNKCTRCHECSECGPNEQIRQPCTDEMDTVCESIIPPDPVPTTTSRPTSTKATTRASTLSTTYMYTSMATSEVSLAGTKSTHAVTYKSIGTTEIRTLSKAPAEKEEPKTVYKGIDVMGLLVSASVLIIILFVIVVVLLTIIWKQRKKIKELEKKFGKLDESSGLATTRYELDRYEESGPNLDESQAIESMVQEHGNPESNKGSPSKSLERQRSTGEGGEDSGSNRGSLSGEKSGNICINYADMHGGGRGDSDGKEIDDRPQEGKSEQGSDLPRGTAPSKGGGSGTGDSDGSCTTGPDKDDGGATVDPPKPLSSATSRPMEQKSDEADPLMEKQAVPKKGHKRKGPEAHSLRIFPPGWKKSGNENG